jgi:hypothetical protein
MRKLYQNKPKIIEHRRMSKASGAGISFPLLHSTFSQQIDLKSESSDCNPEQTASLACI